MRDFSNDSTGASTNYLFGDSGLAARRLRLLARVFKESTRHFLVTAAGDTRWGLAVDLGCGPGFTTRLIAQTLQCDRVVGYDTSGNFLNDARGRIGGAGFAVHDVTSVPFPCGHADILFCRFLLTHLRNPHEIITRWTTQMNPDGLLMIEETEAIRTNHPVFARYLELVEAVLASRSNRLYAGATVGALVPQGLSPNLNRVRTVAVRSSDAARMFILNLTAWRDADFVRANYRRESVLELQRDLAQIAAQRSPAREIIWEMRQAAFRADFG